MAVERSLGIARDQVIHHAYADSGKPHAEDIVTVKPANDGVIETRQGHEGPLADDIDEREPEKLTKKIPERDIQLFYFALHDRHIYVEGDEHQAYNY